MRRGHTLDQSSVDSTDGPPYYGVTKHYSIIILLLSKGKTMSLSATVDTQLAIRQGYSAKQHLAVHVWEGAMRSCSTWRLNSYNLNLKEQSQTGDFLAQMDGDLPGQAKTVNVGYVSHHQRPEKSLTRSMNLNVRSSILQGASTPVISGGEFNSFVGDYNRITINICKTLSSKLRFFSRTGA